MDLERIAASGGEMPDGLSLPEQLLFLTLRELYRNFQSGAVNRERGSREKRRIMVAYDKLKNTYEMMEYHRSIRSRLEKEIGVLYKCDCENCRKVFRILDGVDRRDIPDDVRELNEWNEKLRDLVKERSERAGELRTQLDRIKWIIESDVDYEDQIKSIKEVIDNGQKATAG